MIRTPHTAVVGVTLDADDVRRLDAAAARSEDTRAAYLRKMIRARLREERTAQPVRSPEPTA